MKNEKEEREHKLMVINRMQGMGLTICLFLFLKLITIIKEATGADAYITGAFAACFSVAFTFMFIFGGKK